jgi:hypothetical protein
MMKTIYDRLDDMEGQMDKLQAEINKCSDTAKKMRLEDEMDKLCVKYNQLWNREENY